MKQNYEDINELLLANGGAEISNIYKFTRESDQKSHRLALMHLRKVTKSLKSFKRLSLDRDKEAGAADWTVARSLIEQLESMTEEVEEFLSGQSTVGINREQALKEIDRMTGRYDALEIEVLKIRNAEQAVE